MNFISNASSCSTRETLRAAFHNVIHTLREEDRGASKCQSQLVGTDNERAHNPLNTQMKACKC